MAAGAAGELWEGASCLPAALPACRLLPFIACLVASMVFIDALAFIAFFMACRAFMVFMASLNKNDTCAWTPNKVGKLVHHLSVAARLRAGTGGSREPPVPRLWYLRLGI